MSSVGELLFTMALFLMLLSAGMAVPLAILLPALAYLLLQGGVPALKALGLVSWGSMDSFTLASVPLFLLMAEILRVSGLSGRTYSGLGKLVSRLPGGLLQTNIIGSAIFASVSGSSIATAASIGSVALPQLTRRNYDRRLAAGSLAAGGTLGILLPPSFGMIVYGTFTQTSVPRLFMAGLAPGLLMTACFIAYLAIHATLRPGVAPVETGVRSLSEFGRALLDVIPFAILIVGALGGVYAGLITTTEGATIGCLLSLALACIFGHLDWAGVQAALSGTIRASGNILFIIFSAYVFSFAVSFGGVDEALTDRIASLHIGRVEFLLLLFALYTVLGCLIESIGMIVITVPLIFPILHNYNIDPLLFGVMLVMFVELGQISPPIGINLFVIQSIWDGKLSDVVRGTIPFHIIMILVLIAVLVWPDIALWLPHHL